MPTKSYANSGLNDPSKTRNTTHVDFNDKNLDNVRFVKIKSLPAVPEHLTPKFYVDEAISYWIDESSLLILDRDEKLKLDGQDSIFLNFTLKTTKAIIEIPTKWYVDSLHERSGNRRDIPSVLNDQDNELDNNKFNNLDSVTVKRNPDSDNELSNEKMLMIQYEKVQ